MSFLHSDETLLARTLLFLQTLTSRDQPFLLQSSTAPTLSSVNPPSREPCFQAVRSTARALLTAAFTVRSKSLTARSPPPRASSSTADSWSPALCSSPPFIFQRSSIFQSSSTAACSISPKSQIPSLLQSCRKSLITNR